MHSQSKLHLAVSQQRQAKNHHVPKGSFEDLAAKADINNDQSPLRRSRFLSTPLIDMVDEELAICPDEDTKSQQEQTYLGVESLLSGDDDFEALEK